MSSSLEESIRRESGGREPSQVDRLCLDQAKAGDGLALLAPFTELISLSIQDADISSLDSLPALNRLNTLKLNDNKIKGGLQNLERLPELQKLYLASNKVQSLECLQPLAKLTKLEWLDLEGNPVTKVDGYSQFVWDLLPSLIVLDGKNREGQELEENEDDDESEDDEDENNDDAAEGEDDEEEAGDGEEQEDGDEEEEEEEADGKEGEYEEYVDYGAILTGEKEAEDDEEDADFAPREEPEDFDIPDEDEEEADGDNGESLLGKRLGDADGADSGRPAKK